MSTALKLSRRVRARRRTADRGGPSNGPASSRRTTTHFAHACRPSTNARMRFARSQKSNVEDAGRRRRRRHFALLLKAGTLTAPARRCGRLLRPRGGPAPCARPTPSAPSCSRMRIPSPVSFRGRRAHRPAIASHKGERSRELGGLYRRLARVPHQRR